MVDSRARALVLFGSYARGDAREDSDIDVLVLLEDPVDLGPDIDTAVHAIYPLQLEIERPIHAIPASYTTFEAGQYAIYREAKREGILL